MNQAMLGMFKSGRLACQVSPLVRLAEQYDARVPVKSFATRSHTVMP